MADVKLKAPKGCTGLSFDGAEYVPDKRGFVTVPEEAVPALIEHGCTGEQDAGAPADAGA
jgi:hypothetical protein